MYNINPYNCNKSRQNAVGPGQPQFDQTADMDTTFGYPMAPSPTPMQQAAAQQMTGQQAPQAPPVTPQTPPVTPQPQFTGSAPVDFETLTQTPIFDTEYTQGYLRTQIGARVKVEFLIGTNMLIDREGTLVDVGISYIIIREVETDDLLLCDIYSIKFVRFYY